MQLTILTFTLGRVLLNSFAQRLRCIESTVLLIRFFRDICGECTRHTTRGFIACRLNSADNMSKAKHLEAVDGIDGLIYVLAHGKLSSRARGKIGNLGMGN
jgi:hypothetical protein